jgi:hypothetical protein
MFALVLLAGNNSLARDSGQTAMRLLTIVVLSRRLRNPSWGYDGNTKKMVAYQFLANGVFTKSVEGWVGDSFVSHREGNGATVSVKNTDRSSTVNEDCARSV